MLLPNTVHVCFIHDFPHVINVYVAFVLYMISNTFSFDLHARMLAACFVTWVCPNVDTHRFCFVAPAVLNVLFSIYTCLNEWLCMVWT